jgi:hypothetical protein
MTVANILTNQGLTALSKSKNNQQKTNKMKAKIEITSNYGFDHNWTLTVETDKKQKSFYLGQDVKFCRRVLGLEPRDIVRQIGTAEISNGLPGNEKLASFICKKVGLTGKNMNKIAQWELCAE